jgi:hypothetical protein
MTNDALTLLNNNTRIFSVAKHAFKSLKSLHETS